MYLPPYVKAVITALESAGYEAYAVGGCVRDALLGLTPGDYDVTTSATPGEVKNTIGGLFRIHDTGLKHGTVTVVSGNNTVEVTTFRIDGDYTDNRRPDSVRFTRSLKDDLSRRDFTVNAMAYSDKTGIIDLYGGRRDLDNKIIRAVGGAEERFGEDGLRILRALRFAAAFGFSLDNETKAAALKLKNLIKKLSGERIAAELNKLILGEVGGVISEFTDVFAEFIPEITACKGFEQHSKYHDRDVLTHTLSAVDCAPRDKVTRLALLFHDTGKPQTYEYKDGAGHFKGHAAVSERIAHETMNRLKYDNDTAYKTRLLVKYHDLPINGGQKSVKRLLNRFGEEMFFRLIDVHIADNEAKAADYRCRSDIFREAANTAREIIQNGGCFCLKQLEVNGADVMELGYAGAKIGEALNCLLQAVISEKCPNEKDALIKFLRERGL